MKFAKLIVIVFVVNIVVSLALPTLACAGAKYVRVTQDGVPLYTNAEIKKVTCLLEKSYYLVVVDEIDEFFKVELLGSDKSFPKIVGFVTKNSVDIQTDAPVVPLYPTVTVSVAKSSARLYFSPLISSDLLVVATNTQQMSYYGKLVDGETTWYFVYFNGYFGYVDSCDVTPANVALHPTPLPQPEPTVPQPEPQQPAETNPILPHTTSQSSEILLIAFAGILATALTCALFLPKQKDNSKSFYTENR